METHSSKRPSVLSDWLKDTSVTDILINDIAGVYVDRGGSLSSYEPTLLFSTSEALQEWWFSEMAAIGRGWDAKHPFLDGVLSSGHRFHVVFPGICPLSSQTLGARGMLISLRAPGHQRALDTLTSFGPGPGLEILRQAVTNGRNILISGPTGSGKTTLLNLLLSFVPETERILALEDTPELHPKHPHFLSLLSRPPSADGTGEVTLRLLLKQTLRMRPDRIVMGECRGAEILDLLQMLNTGHQGTMATVHASSSREALKRVETLALLSGASIPAPVIRDLIGSGIQVVVQLERTSTGTREIREILRVEGKEGDTILTRPLLNWSRNELQKEEGRSLRTVDTDTLLRPTKN